MATNNKRVRRKQQRIQALAENSDSYRFFNLLTGPEILSTDEVYPVADLKPELIR